MKNESHSECQWMFPGSHVEVSNNELKEDFKLTDVNIIPSEVIQDKVIKEAGLTDLQFIDPYYAAINNENMLEGGEQHSYPNTCYPKMAPAFNYLFRVSEFADCYNKQNHRCHYDFTYIAEYTSFDQKDAKFEIFEIEIKKKFLEGKEHSEAVAFISSQLGRGINRKINNINRRNNVSIPVNKLFPDSIPEMIYNAILFYADYKKIDGFQNVSTKDAMK